MKPSRLRTIAIFVALSILLLSGCGRSIDKAEVTDPLSESEIEELLAEAIRKETGEQVIVKVESKEELHFTADGVGDSIDGSKPFEHKYYVLGGYSYRLKIMSRDLKYEGTGYYSDGYKKVYKKKKRGTEVVEPSYGYDFEMPYLYHFLKDVEETLAKKYAHFHVANQGAERSDFDLFILDPDYANRREVLRDVLKEINGFAERYRAESISITCRVFLTEDETVYKTTDFYASPITHDGFTEIRQE